MGKRHRDEQVRLIRNIRYISDKDVNGIGMNRSDAFLTEYRDEYVIYHFEGGMVSEFGYTMEGYRIWFYIYIDNRFHEYEVFKLNI